jgi:hypothetical protein
MVRTEAVGPDTHINCINRSEKLVLLAANFFTDQKRIVGSSHQKSHQIFQDHAAAITKNASSRKVKSIALTSPMIFIHELQMMKK